VFLSVFSGIARGSEQEDIERALKADASSKPSSETSAPAPASRGAAVLNSLNPDVSFIADVALAAFSTQEPLQTGGHDPLRRGFTLQGLEMAVGAAVDPYFRFDANLVFHQEGVEIEEVYATTLALPARLQLRVGQFLTRFGRINNTHLHSWNFVDQPFAIGRIFGGEGNRGLGLELSYLTPLPWFVELVGSVTDAAGEGTARSFYGDTDLGVNGLLDFQYTFAVKQFFPLSEAWSLLWGLSLADGPNSLGHGNRTDVYGTDLYLKFRPATEGNFTTVSLQTEWFYRRRQVPRDSLRDVNGYAELFYRFAQRWGTAARYEFGSPARLSSGQVGADELDAEWTSSRHRISANATFWPTEFSRVRLQGSTDLLGWQDRPNWALMLAFEFAVGPHGAHAF
jgi:hypothetical protein